MTSYTVVEGWHWSVVGKSFGEISTTSPLASTDVLITMSAEEFYIKDPVAEEVVVCAHTKDFFGGRHSSQRLVIFIGFLVDNATGGKISKRDHCTEF